MNGEKLNSEEVGVSPLKMLASYRKNTLKSFSVSIDMSEILKMKVLCRKSSQTRAALENPERRGE